uniref:Putative secreted peptide n=1 Tax=Anopheles braziliensis TaxID=58242 RepID=A0A2M3ZVR8_9DIPT
MTDVAVVLVWLDEAVLTLPTFLSFCLKKSAICFSVTFIASLYVPIVLNNAIKLSLLDIRHFTFSVREIPVQEQYSWNFLVKIRSMQ